MGRLQKDLEVLLATVGNVSHGQIPRARVIDIPSRHMNGVVRDVYRKLGGAVDVPVIRLGNWDVEFDGVAVELDEQLHFNKYRALTLRSRAYENLPGFPLEDYQSFCRERQHECMRAGRYLGKWTNPTSALQFGPPAPFDDLSGGGAPRWKQRAFYDFVKDTLPLVSGVRVARLSIWDLIRDNGKERMVADVLRHPGKKSARALANLVEHRGKSGIRRAR